MKLLTNAACGLAATFALPPLMNVAFAADARVNVIEEVVVNARKREENLQTTPVAVTATTEKGLELKQILNVSDIQRTAPNLGISSGATAGSKFVFVSLRGQQNLQSGVGNDPAVGIYVDGVYMARPSTGVMDLNDVQRVEVLRGPQGTLFGRNTIGGAVSIITNEPTDKLEGKVSVDIGQYQTKDISGVINVPISNDLDVRVSGHHKSHIGYGENRTLNQDAADLDHDDFVRFGARYQINDDWNAKFSADWNEIEDKGVLNGLAAWNDTTGLLGANGISLDPYLHTGSDWYKSYGSAKTDVDKKYTPSDMVRSSGFSLKFNGDLGWSDFSSITAWRTSSSKSYQDLDATPIDILQVYSTFDSQAFSQELQLSGSWDALSWTGGLFYFRELGQETSEAQSFGFLGTGFFENFSDVENVSYAAFLQTYYQFTDKVRGVAGFRYTKDERNAVLHHTNVVNDPSTCNVAIPDGGAFPPCNQTLKADFEYPAWVLGLDYQMTDEIFLYAKTSGASMAGGWNLRTGAEPAFNPQDVVDVEFGVKADWLDGRLRTNLAAFHMWQSDIQRNVSTVVNNRTTQYVRNSGDSQIDGVEFEGTALPWDGMELTATLGWMHGTYDSGTYTEEQAVPTVTTPTPGCTPIAGGAYTCAVDRSGEKLLQLPEFTYSLGATQSWPLDIGTLRVHLDYSFIDDQTFFQQTASQYQSAATKAAFAKSNQLGRLDGYGLVNGNVTLDMEKPGVTLTLWARNLTDKKYVQMNFADLYTSLGTSIDYVGEPRIVGLTASYRFQ
ncbi:MAG: TonB-dependent receptor [Verrucomicrobiaceae bacterium]|nr:TonB-dependent receptor [Verrucomicrobiaceae bacterium]